MTVHVIPAPSLISIHLEPCQQPRRQQEDAHLRIVCRLTAAISGRYATVLDHLILHVKRLIQHNAGLSKLT